MKTRNKKYRNKMNDNLDDNKEHVEESCMDTSAPEENGSQNCSPDVADEPSGEEAAPLEARLAETEAALEKEKKEYMFLMAEFDNFRKRTMREKSELIRNAGENVLKGLLPILDDFDRGLKASEGATDVAAVREGMELICQKLRKYMEQNGVREMETDGTDFDADRHEAIASIPAPTGEAKGKILDTVEKGYTINDKVLRHAKVVVGQ